MVFNIKQRRFVLLLMLTLLGGTVCLLLIGQGLPPLPTNWVPTEIEPPANVVAVTNVILFWKPYTNAWFVVEGRTNLTSTNWYFVTNVPIWCTNQIIPVNAATKPEEYFRMKTMIN